jgi:hypothetical protein
MTQDDWTRRGHLATTAAGPEDEAERGSRT